MWQIVFCSHRALSRLLTHMRHGIPFPLSCLLLFSLPSRHDRAASAIREVAEKFWRGISNCLRWLCDHHEEEGDGDDDGNVAALSDPVSAYGRQIVCAICALKLSAPPAQIVYDAFELCFKKKSQKDSQSQRRHRTRWPHWWGEADRKRWQLGGPNVKVRNVSIVKINYCGFSSS